MTPGTIVTVLNGENQVEVQSVTPDGKTAICRWDDDFGKLQTGVFQTKVLKVVPCKLSGAMNGGTRKTKA